MWAQTQSHSQVHTQCYFRLKISTAHIEFSWAGSQKELQAWLCYDSVDVLKWKASTPCEGRVIIRLVTSVPIRSRNHSVGPWRFFPTASLYSCRFQSIIPAFAITWETNMCETLEFMKAAVLHNEEILMRRQDLCPQCVHNLTRQIFLQVRAANNFIESNSVQLLTPNSYLQEILQGHHNMCEMYGQIPTCINSACFPRVWCSTGSVLWGAHRNSALPNKIIPALTAHYDSPHYPQSLLLLLHIAGSQEHEAIVKSRKEGKHWEIQSHLWHRMFVKASARGEMNQSLTAFSFWRALTTSSWAEIAFSEFMRDFYSCHMEASLHKHFS